MKKLFKCLSLTSLCLVSLSACGLTLPDFLTPPSSQSLKTTSSSVATSSAGRATIQSGQSAISPEAAVKVVLDQLGVTESDISQLVVKPETDDGKPVYDISFIYDELTYDYTVDAQTGQLVEKEVDATAVMPDGLLSGEDAKALVFEDFSRVYGVGEADVTNLTVEQSSEEGRMSYEISFAYNAVAFSYDIDAETGEIIAFEEDDLE